MRNWWYRLLSLFSPPRAYELQAADFYRLWRPSVTGADAEGVCGHVSVADA